MLNIILSEKKTGTRFVRSFQLRRKGRPHHGGGSSDGECGGVWKFVESGTRLREGRASAADFNGRLQGQLELSQGSRARLQNIQKRYILREFISKSFKLCLIKL